MPCNGCTLCCRLLPIPELGKRAGQECDHCRDGGCSIYGHHPQSCRLFRCAWLQSGGHEDLRPDKCGVVFERASATIMHGLVDGSVPPDTDVVRGQVDSFRAQGFSIVLTPIVTRQHHIVPAPGRMAKEVYEEFQALGGRR